MYPACRNFENNLRGDHKLRNENEKDIIELPTESCGSLLERRNATHEG
jgi:hypothetical protein